jgi:hypothetical protein
MTAQAFHAALTDVDTSAQVPMGAIYERDNKAYQYVKFSGSNAVAVGDLVGYVASAGATDDMTTVDGAVGVAPAGIAMAVVATAGGVQYGWVQVRGLAVSSAAIAGGAAAGQVLKQGTYPAVTLQTAVTIAPVGVLFDATNKLVQLALPN